MRISDAQVWSRLILPQTYCPPAVSIITLSHQFSDGHPSRWASRAIRVETSAHSPGWPDPPLPHEWCRQGESWRSFWNSGWGRPRQGRHPGLDFAWLEEKNRHGKKTLQIISWRGGASPEPNAKCEHMSQWAVLWKRGNWKPETMCQAMSLPMLQVCVCVCVLHVCNVFNKKWTNRFEFTLSWLLCSANKSSSLLITPLCPLWTWPLPLLDCGFIALLLIKSVPNLHGLSVQSEDSLKDSFSESSYFNNCSLGLLVEAPLSHALSCLLLKTWELRRLGIVTHLQIRRLLAEVPHLEGAGYGARVPDLSAALAPAWAQLLASNPSWWPVSQLPHCGLNEIMYMKCKPK